MHNSSILPWAAMRTNEATYVEHFCICKGQSPSYPPPPLQAPWLQEKLQKE